MPKTVLITGGARGIGRACALSFAKAGYSVAICYNSSEALAHNLVALLRDGGCDSECFPCDVSDPVQADAMVDAVLRRFGHIDTLICNSGIAQQKLFTDITDQDWRIMMDTNAGGVFFCCRAALPSMISRKSGHIITISSVWGMRGASCEVHYSASKAAVIGLTRALAKEVAPSGINVNCIAPGVIDTDMCACFDEDAMQQLAEETPAGRIGTPEDVAAAALFLSSDASLFITGQVLGVDGGFGV